MSKSSQVKRMTLGDLRLPEHVRWYTMARTAEMFAPVGAFGRKDRFVASYSTTDHNQQSTSIVRLDLHVS